MSNQGNQNVDDGTTISCSPKIGGKDNLGRSIDRVYWSTKKFYIYQADKEIRYCLPEDYATAAALRQKIFFLTEVRSNIERMRGIAGVPKDEFERAGAELAGALARAFETDIVKDPAKSSTVLKSLQRTEMRLKHLVKSSCRKRYLFGAAESFIFFVILLVLFMFFVPKMVNFGPVDTKIVSEYAAFSFFGALGAFLSVLMGTKSIDFDINLEHWEDFVSGLTRIGIGVFAGIVIGLAVHSEFLNPDFNAGDSKPILLYFLAFLAGFSESLVPNLLKREEDSVSGSNPADDGDEKRGAEQPKA